jgi:hypothetical protein
VAETPDKKTQREKQPEAAQQWASGRVPAIVVSLFALAVIGAATANFLPNFDRFSLPSFNRFSLPNFDRFSLPNFNRFAPQSPHETASVPIPDPAVRATLKDIQLSQQQNAGVLVSLTQSSATQQAVLVSLTQSSATQQADLKKISRQLSSLAAQADALQSAVTPLTLTTSSIPHSNTRVRVVRTSRKIISALPKPVGPVSVRGAPLSPAPAPGSG